MKAKLVPKDGKFLLAVSPATPGEALDLVDALPHLATVELNGKTIHRASDLFSERSESFIVYIDITEG